MNTITLLIALTTLLTSPAGDDVDQIVRKTKALHESTRSARIGFTQAGTSSGSFKGTITYAQGNRFRMELPNQTIVCDGTKMWTYAPRKHQVVITRAVSQGNRVTPNDIFTSFPGDYTPKLGPDQRIGGTAVWVINCVASPSGKRIGDISRATLYIDKRTYRFRRIDCISPSLGALTLNIASARYGVALKDAIFTFTPPNGVRVVDLSK